MNDDIYHLSLFDEVWIEVKNVELCSKFTGKFLGMHILNDHCGGLK